MVRRTNLAQNPLEANISVLLSVLFKSKYILEHISSKKRI